MNERTYFRLTGVIFGLVALFHLVRLLFGWSVAMGPYTIPIWVSAIGFFVAAVISFMGLKHGKLI